MQNIFRFSLAVALVALIGCEKKEEAVQMEPAPSSQRDEPDWQESLVAMTDNAAQYDLSVHDIHFIPHSTELSGLGARRLDQLARIMEPYGGTIRYQTSSTDASLVETRLQHVRDYLAATGRDISKIQVAAGLSGGRGVKASEALQAKANAFKPEKGDSSGSSGSSSYPGSMLQSSGE